jgi:hypothetical protein
LSGINALIKSHQAKVRGLVNRKGVAQLRKLYETTRAELEQRLANLKKQGKGKTFTAYHSRVVLLQTIAAIKDLAIGMSGQLKSNGRLVGTLSQKQLLAEVKALEKRYSGHTPVLQVEQAAVLTGIYNKSHPSLLNRYKKSQKFYTVPVVKAVRMELAKAILTGETVDKAVDRVAAVDGVFEEQRWRAERIVRTEMAYAFGVTKQETMKELVTRDMPDMQKKLIATFDDRTGEDSKELHGQSVPINDPFVWEVKNSKGIPTGEVIRYMQPPNRPNDREVVIPWRPGWVDTSLTEPL